jgi:phage tail sheath gpL-like
MPITGYPSSHRAPFTAAEILFNQGPSTASAGVRTAIYVAPMTTAGDATVATVYPITDEATAIARFGSGSPLHRCLRMHLRANKNGKLYGIAYAASSGAGVATATGTITVGGAPTASGLFTVYVCGERVDTAFTTSSTATTIGDALAAQINAKTHLPFTAANVTGTVTLTAKIAGASQGDGTVGVYRFRASVEPGKGVTAATSGAALGLGTGVAGVDGATTELVGLQGALAAIATSRYYYMGFSVWSDGHTAEIETHVATKSEPNPGHRSCAWTGYTHTLAACTTIAIARNFHRQHIVWQKNSEHDPAELCANVIAIHQKHEAIDSAFPGFDSYRQSDWLILPAFANADWPSGNDFNDAVTDGITAILSDQTGSMLGMSVNTKSKDAAGSLDDFRATERHRVSAMDFFIDRTLTRFVLTYTSVGFKLKADVLDSNGNPNPNQVLAPKVLTPSLFKPWWLKQIDEAVDVDAILQDAAAWKESSEVSIDPSNVSRLRVKASGRTIDVGHQFEVAVSETTPA